MRECRAERYKSDMVQVWKDFRYPPDLYAISPCTYSSMDNCFSRPLRKAMKISARCRRMGKAKALDPNKRK